MRRGVKFAFVFTVIGMLIIHLYNPDYEKRCAKSLENEKELEIFGIVTDKYFVNENVYPYLEIQSFKDSVILKKSFHSEFTGIFDYVEVGDSIHKPAGTLIYKIQREGLVEEMKYTEFCNKE